VVLLELPLSASEMVAALYGEHDRLTSADLGTEEEVWGPGWGTTANEPR